MRLTIACLTLLFTLSLHAQTNLVPNGGFELYNSCPTSYSGVTYDDGFFPYVENWFAPSGGSSDYFNACASDASSASIPDTYWWGYNPSHFCDAMAGFFTYEDGYDYREYIEVQLTEPLEAGVQYYVEFYAATCFYPDAGGSYDFILATDEIGLHFSEDKVLEGFSSGALTDYEPQIEMEEGLYPEDSSLWYKVSGIYLAAGGEEYITIGNFRGDDETDYVIMYEEDPGGTLLSGYVFVDDVLVTEYTGDVPDIPGDIILCEGEDTELTAPYAGVSYIWNTGETTQTITVDTEGEYSVIVDFECDTNEYSFNVYVSPIDAITTYTENYICTTEFPLTLSSEPGYTDYEWTTGAYTMSIVISEPGLYICEASNICTYQIDTFQIGALDPAGINIDLGNDTLICSNEAWEMTLDATNDFDTYTWSTGETTQTISVEEEGVYSVSAENICGIWADGIVIEAGPILVKPDLGEDLVLCDEDGFNSVIFTAPEQECTYLWQSGETTQSIEVHEPNLVWVECKNICGKVRDTVIVKLCTWLYVPNAFSPNGDGINDLFTLVAYPNVELISFTIYNRWGEILFETSDIKDSWDGTFNGESMPMETYVYYLEFDEYGFVSRKKGSFTLIK
ncbi:MAG: gliding motility-associated C-terminal domain-containing protein [Chitinophagales bacterium]|nr:gliding motility-associated C-terminal domain-containing protein [Chitinophagales bacterium]